MAYLAESRRDRDRPRTWEDPELFPRNQQSTIEVDPPCFTDFLALRKSPTADQWFEPYACWGKEQGLVKGYAGGEFKPLQTVNFAEAAKILIETSGQPVANEENFDHWAQGYIESLNADRAIPTSIQNAGQPLNRAMAAQLIYNYNQVEYKALENQTSNAFIWNGEGYDLFENLGVAHYYHFLKKDGEIYYIHLLDEPNGYKKLENVDVQSFKVYQYHDQHTSYSGKLKSINAGVATDQFAVLDQSLKPIEGSTGGNFEFFEESFQGIPDNYIGYGRDDKRVYLINCYEGCWPEILPDSNADDFEVIGNGFSRSGDQYYYLSQPIDLSVNIDELELLTPVLRKQGEKVYYFQPDIEKGWQVKEFDYLGMINLRTPSGANRDVDYDEYYMSDGENVFMLKSSVFQKIEGADVNTFRLINWGENSLFAMDDGAIYLGGEKAAESNVGTFEVLGDFFELYRSTKVGYYVSDGETVYLVSCWQWNPCEVSPVPANGAGFESLGDGYAVDDAQAYYAAQVLELDLDTLIYLGKGYLKDKDRVYYPKYYSRDEIALEISGADAQNFELNLANNENLFCTFPMAKDGQNLYLASRVMKNIDKEDDISFFGSSYVEDIDYDSFEWLDENGFFFKDKSGFYRVGFNEDACLSLRWEKLEKVESDSFTPFKPHYYSSQGQVYFIERYSDTHLNQVEEATFEPLVKTFNNSVDLEHSYVAKDANFAYYKEDVIPLDVDVPSFEYDQETQVLQDKNRQYTLEEIETVLEECAYDYEPVCGQLKEGQQSFRNSCLAKKAGSTTITDGLCTEQEKPWEQACLAQRGRWIPESNYCRDFDRGEEEEQTCTEMGGERYSDCGSGCDPYSDAEECVDACVPLCFFE